MASSRLNYLGSDVPSGKKPRNAPAPPRPRGSAPPPSANGVPGPEARRLDIAEIVRTVGMRYRHAFAIPADPDAGELDLRTAAPTVGDVTLTNTGAALLLQGKAHGVLPMECSRCLTRYDQPIDFELEEVFDLVTEHNAFRQEEVRAVDENVTAPVIDGTVLDLAELLRQSLLLAAPLQPLCRDDCAGIPGAEPEAKAHRPLEALGALWQAREGDDPQ